MDVQASKLVAHLLMCPLCYQANLQNGFMVSTTVGKKKGKASFCVDACRAGFRPSRFPSGKRALHRAWNFGRCRPDAFIGRATGSHRFRPSSLVCGGPRTGTRKARTRTILDALRSLASALAYAGRLGRQDGGGTYRKHPPAKTTNPNCRWDYPIKVIERVA